MLDRLSDIPKERLAFTAVVVVALMRFLNLGFLDLQAWDEALYAVRAEGILRFGGWVDQTGFAIDGLYSSLPPPLYVWLTTLSFALFGVTEFATRLFSAVFGGLTVILVYRIGKRVADTNVGFIAALLFGLNPFVTFYARQGQFDATLVFFLAAAIFVLLEWPADRSVARAFLAGLCVGAALMTKLYVGLGIPFVYALWIVFHRPGEQRIHWNILGVMTVVALAVAAPWHVFMTATHGEGDPLFFLRASALLERSLTGVEGNVKPLEVLYFVNQLFVLFPFGVAWFGHGLYRAMREKQPGWYLLGMWFLLFFLIFSLMRTKLAVYMLPMLVPASLIASREIVKVNRGAYTPRSASVFVTLTLLSVLWSSSQAWRNAVKAVIWRFTHLELPLSEEILTLLPLVILSLMVLVLWHVSVRKGWIDILRPAIPYFLLVPSFLIFYYQIVAYDKFQYRDGATELVQCVLEKQPSEIIVAGYERNPQLTYYLEGSDVGWRDDLPVTRIVPPKERERFRSWLTDQLTGAPGDALVVIEKDKFIRYEWVTAEEVNPPDYALVFDSRRYAAFLRTSPIQLAYLRRAELP
ncbi:MAG: hypothetical protein FJ217_15590 [Ignavibacteria bacterium]|nr:hypothetical protein [Ignavibacteria bacterium]